jgi:dethiobiotin synthetase
LKLAGWIANRVDPQMRRFAENLATLERRLPAPLLGVIPHGVGGAAAAQHLDLPAT